MTRLIIVVFACLMMIEIVSVLQRRNQIVEAAPSDTRTPPSGRLGETIHLGKTLIEQTSTHPLTKPYVGNRLNCSSCHLKAGTDLKAATFVGVATAYPAYSPREGRVLTLEDRILNCFMRSCNGVRPPLGSEVSVSMAAYITWLSTDLPIKMNEKQSLGPHALAKVTLDPALADLDRGKALYSERCASCHANDGQGDAENPPVWGADSYNDGAGLATISGLAAWLKVAMPLDEGNLSDQEALAIAQYVNSHDRPKFQLEDHVPEKSRLGEYNSEAKP